VGVVDEQDQGPAGGPLDERSGRPSQQIGSVIDRPFLPLAVPG
jgi:hypothetical protein